MADEKLVRDRIPEIIRNDGFVPVVSTAGGAEYKTRLRDKLAEEVAEFMASESDPIELVDILEVVYALALSEDVSAAELDALRAAKARSHGTFSAGLVWHGNRG